MARPKATRRVQKRAQPASARLRDHKTWRKAVRPTADEANLIDASTADTWERTVEAGRGIQVYRQATENTAENLDAVLMCSLDLGHRAQRMQQAWLCVLGRSLSLAVRGPAGLLYFKSMAELIEAQQSMYVEAYNAVECGTRLLQLPMRVAHKAG